MLAAGQTDSLNARGVDVRPVVCGRSTSNRESHVPSSQILHAARQIPLVMRATTAAPFPIREHEPIIERTADAGVNHYGVF
jgi:hypothetical protein